MFTVQSNGSYIRWNNPIKVGKGGHLEWWTGYVKPILQSALDNWATVSEIPPEPSKMQVQKMLFSFYSMYLQKKLIFAFKRECCVLKKDQCRLSQKERRALVVLGLLTTLKGKKRERIITVLRAKCTLLCESCAEPGTGEAVDGRVEAQHYCCPSSSRRNANTEEKSLLA